MYKCHNFILCRNTLERDDSPICTSCRLTLPDGHAQLTFHEQVECPHCGESAQGVCQPRCEHVLCIGCFQRCYYENHPFTRHEPHFPYPEMEEDYYDDPFNVRWDTHYPLIQRYLIEWLEWDNAFEEYSHTSHNSHTSHTSPLRHCPLCRQ